MAALPDLETFRTGYDAGKAQLVWQWLEADLETPVSAWLKLCHDEPYSILLESVEGGNVLGRYSAIALKPDLLWRCRKAQAERSDDLETWYDCKGEALDSLKGLVTACRIDLIPDDLPPMASGGLFGYMGYDMVRLAEQVPDNNPDPIDIADATMMRPTLMVIFDNVKHMMCISTPVYVPADQSNKSADEAYHAAKDLIERTMATLMASLPADTLQPPQTAYSETPEIRSNVTRAQYHDMVKKAVEYIHAGDIFQVVPSQRFSMDFDLPSFQLYRTLRRLNPSPFLFHLRMDDFALIGSSPEILVRVRDNNVAIRPIAGTRKRGRSPAEDKALAEDLLADPKERAEHLMLLDLARNDIGRVAETGSVNVTDRFIIEQYSHVMHIVSHVEGRLRPDYNPLDALFSGFPAGTVSGAPKIRAMEIIDELEPVRRSFYAGCIGYLSGRGDVDSCITLRTGLVKDGKLYVQAGGGVVADSDPEFEYQESCNKAQAVLSAAKLCFVQAHQEEKKTGD